jgi:hypothetical protein
MDEREQQKLDVRALITRDNHTALILSKQRIHYVYTVLTLIKQHPRFIGSWMQHGASSSVVTATVAECRTLPSYQHGQHWDQTHEGA